MGRDNEDDVHNPCSSSSSTDSNPNNNNNDSYNNLHGYDDVESRSVGSCSSSSLSSSTRNGYHCYSSKDLSTDLRLVLSISSLSHAQHFSSSPRGQYSDWPPVKAKLRNTLSGKSNSRLVNESLFVKVFLEGIPIGRKLNLLAHHGYPSLITTISHMFKTTILFPHIVCHNSSQENHILTYEDKEGDWMVVGDVPWELFLTTVTRLKIAALDNCHVPKKNHQFRLDS